MEVATMPAELKGAPRRAKVAGRLYPTDAHRVNFLLRNPKSNVEKGLLRARRRP
jgi:hypothetical protein